MSALVLLGAGTDIGKTFVACGLIAELRKRGSAVDALKPVLSGYDQENAEQSDAGRLLAALGRPINEREIARIAPFRYAAPLAPNLAARREGSHISFDEIVALTRARVAASETLLLVETAGGVMSPLSDDRTMLDFVRALGAPSVLIGGTYLGAVSHLLTARAAMQAVGVSPRALIVNDTPGGDVGLATTLDLLAPFVAGERLVALARADALFESLADLV